MEEVSHLVIKVNSGDVVTADARLGSLGRSTDRVMGLIGRLITIAAGLAVFKQAAAAIGEFDHNMQGVLAVTRSTTEQMELLKQQAREVGSTTQVSGADAALGMKLLGQAGFNTAQIMATIPGMLDLAVAGEISIADAADIASSALAGFRLKASEAGRVADVLAVAAGESNTSVFMMGDAMKYVASIGAGMNKSIEEVSAAIGVLSNAGLQGSMAGTGLRQVLSSLASPTKEAADILRAYGIKISEVNPEINDLATIFDRLHAAGISASDALVIAGDRGGNALTALVNKTEDFHKLNLSLNNVEGRAKEMAQVMGDDLPGDMKRLKGAVDELFLSIGDAGLRDALRGAAQDARAFTLAAADMVKSGEAAAWIDLLTTKLSLLDDGFENIGESWAITAEFMSKEGKGAKDTIVEAFKNMPENIRAYMELTGATFGLLYVAWKHNHVGMYDLLKTYMRLWIEQAKITGVAMGKLLNPFTTIKEHGDIMTDFVNDQALAMVKFGNAGDQAWTTYKAGWKDAIKTWEEEVDAILKDRQANIDSSDAKLKAIEELREAYKKLMEARKAAEANTANNAGTVGDAPTPTPRPTHFNTQEFEQLRKQLQMEERTVQESYDLRLELIRSNTEAGSQLRLDLETSLNERLTTEMEDAHQARFDRLTAQYAAEQNALQMALDAKTLSETAFREQSAALWKEYTDSVTGISVTGSQTLAKVQQGMMADVLGRAADVASSLASMAEEGSALQKVMFVSSKAIAMAQAYIMTELAAISALAAPPIGLGPVAGLPYSAAIRALGYASIGIMGAQTIMEVSKHEHGGMIPAGKYGIVGETGLPELVRGPATVTSARATADMMSGRSGNSGNMTVNIINEAGDQVETRKREDSDGKILDVIIKRVRSELNVDARGGSAPWVKSFAEVHGLRRGVA